MYFSAIPFCNKQCKADSKALFLRVFGVTVVLIVEAKFGIYLEPLLRNCNFTYENFAYERKFKS